MEPHYRPRQDITRYLTGTPDITGIAAVEESVHLLADAGIAALRTKGIALTSYLVQLADAWLAALGFTLASPRNPTRRGSHVALRHDDAYRISQALIETARVVPDYRTPNRLRLGLPPATTTYTNVHHAMHRLTELVTDRRHLEMTVRRTRRDLIRTRDLLLRRHSRGVTRRCPAWAYVRLSCIASGWAWPGVAWDLPPLAPRLAPQAFSLVSLMFERWKAALLLVAGDGLVQFGWTAAANDPGRAGKRPASVEDAGDTCPDMPARMPVLDI